MENKKLCGNCKYFAQYYIKSNCRFTPVCEGRCLLKQVDSNPRIFFKAACNKWESMEILLQQRKDSIKNVIINISKKLDEIATLLTDKE